MNFRSLVKNHQEIGDLSLCVSFAFVSLVYPRKLNSNQFSAARTAVCYHGGEFKTVVHLQNENEFKMPLTRTRTLARY